jgi:cell division protein ZipA
MAAELRWILLGLSLLLLAGIWWWGSRRSVQAPGNAELREIAPEPRVSPEARVSAEPRISPEPRVSEEGSAREAKPDAARSHWTQPFEPISMRTGEFERVPVLDGPMMVSAGPAPSLTPGISPRPAPAPATPVVPGRVPTLQPEPPSDRIAVAAAQVPDSSEQQKIVTVRVCAAGETRWPGTALLSALEMNGLAYGRYQVFHRRHVDGRSLFCVASLVEPGTFDVARMSSEEFKGVTLFAVLPGPVEPLLTVDELLGAARGLAQELSGMVQDGKGLPMSPQRAAALRDDVARFQASLPKG